MTTWAEFEGGIDEWDAISNTVTREVSQAGFDILSFIISLFENPVTLVIVVGGISVPIGALLFRRRRRVSTATKSTAAETIIPPKPEPTAPAGEMDILQEEIKQYPVGLTRFADCEIP